MKISNISAIQRVISKCQVGVLAKKNVLVGKFLEYQVLFIVKGLKEERGCSLT